MTGLRIHGMMPGDFKSSLTCQRLSLDGSRSSAFPDRRRLVLHLLRGRCVEIQDAWGDPLYIDLSTQNPINPTGQKRTLGHEHSGRGMF